MAKKTKEPKVKYVLIDTDCGSFLDYGNSDNGREFCSKKALDEYIFQELLPDCEDSSELEKDIIIHEVKKTYGVKVSQKVELV